MSWPTGYLWGVSTSAHQFDGNNVASDYWAFEHLDVTLFAEPSGDAPNSHHLWRSDVALAAELGFTAYHHPAPSSGTRPPSASSRSTGAPSPDRPNRALTI